MTESIPLISTSEDLRELATELGRGDWFALDTEFLRERTYWPDLCLVQVASDDIVACIDPLALDSLAPLHTLLHDPSITKVLHAAGQDLEIFHHLDGRVPAPVFDTQIAAPLLGFPEQAGFGKLVEAILDVRLAKGHARTDWTERPLPADALAYAADDVRYLVPLYHHIRGELERRGRLRWLDDEFERLADPARYERPPTEAWQRLKGVDRLGGPSRAAAQALAEWREQAARDANVPRGRILKDDALIEIARALPRDRRELGRIRAARGPGVDRHGNELLRLVAAGRERPAPEMARAPRAVALDGRGEALVDALSALVGLSAAAGELNPATVATRKELARIAGGEPVRTVVSGWRASLIAEELEAFLAGRVRLQHGADGLELVETHA